MKNVFITRKIDEKVISRLSEQFNVDFWPHEDQVCPREELLKQAKRCNALLTMLSDQVNAELLDQGGDDLEIVANLAVGYDNIEVEEAKKRGVMITNTPDVLTDTTADLAFSLLMASARRIVESDRYIKDGNWKSWSPYLLAGKDIHHKTLGIVGMGNIGQAVAQRAKGFDMDILYHTRSRKKEAEEKYNAKHAELDELLTKSDFVLCLAPLTEQTKGMLGSEQFKKMKKSAILINAGRGPVVDEEALIEALKNGEIAGAGLDVFDKEPIDKDHPLLSLANVVAVPHIGSASVETRFAMMDLCAENIINVLSGKDPVTPVK
ncbi:2-hydroxyacid dehydrogenase [Jeotgalibacillus proteolyticus]|uniref:D-glycerate dehydrogenase n=1 Tax=Jeotgalibacillus proteolyticus TaxID=2082395 RepID=A0A2S5GAR2_9BACL|nr:D-glycerate dehydrogenase [Jeotgalibacillus proteolyticus]PPA70086.1 D-glycerate dehydrogenase [Jeotgalibacillus proteolyticus]